MKMLIGTGRILRVLGADPAVNVEATLTVPAGRWWRIIRITVRLVTDANAANRVTSLRVGVGTGAAQPVFGGDQVQTATTTFDHTYGAGLGVSALGSSAGVRNASLPVGLILEPAETIATITLNLQATDNYSAIEALVEEYIWI